MAAVVCIGFVLQQLFVPLHLAWNDHLHPAGQGQHIHSHAAVAPPHDGHHHDLELPGADESKPDHDPHPAADHLDQVAEPAVPQTLDSSVVVIAPQGMAIRLSVDPVPPPPGDMESAPRPPPPRAAAPPRAPPIVA